MLINSYRVNVNGEGCFTLPSEVMGKLGKKYVITASPNHGLLFYNMPEWENTELKLKDLSSMDSSNRRLQQLMLGNASDCDVFSKNKIMLNSSLANVFMKQTDVALLFTGARAKIIPYQDWLAIRRMPNGDLFNKVFPSYQYYKKPDYTSLEQIGLFFKEHIRDLACASRNKNYREFEEILAMMFCQYNIKIIELTQYIKDGGIDLVLMSDHDVYYVQVKAGLKKVNVADLRGLIGSIVLNEGKKGLIVSASGFTSSSKEESELSYKTMIPIDLIHINEINSWASKLF